MPLAGTFVANAGHRFGGLLGLQALLYVAQCHKSERGIRNNNLPYLSTVNFYDFVCQRFRKQKLGWH
jgi:hypothetical protein